MAEKFIYSDLDISDDDSVILLQLQDNANHHAEKDMEEDSETKSKYNVNSKTTDANCTVNLLDNIFEAEHSSSGAHIAVTENQEGNDRGDKMDTISKTFEPRVLRRRPPATTNVDTMPTACKRQRSNKRPPKKTPETWYPLVVGEMKLRLQLPGLFSLDFDVPTQNNQWYADFYNSFQNKYWNMVRKKKITNPRLKYTYNCLICGKSFQTRDYMITDLNRHMGYYIARCEKCPAKFFSLEGARKHRLICLKRN